MKPRRSVVPGEVLSVGWGRLAENSNAEP